jgi:hypothetical protein
MCSASSCIPPRYLADPVAKPIVQVVAAGKNVFDAMMVAVYD